MLLVTSQSEVLLQSVKRSEACCAEEAAVKVENTLQQGWLV